MIKRNIFLHTYLPPCIPSLCIGLKGSYDFLVMNLCMKINLLPIPTWLCIHTIKYDKHLKGKRRPFISPLINFPFLCTPSLNARWISLSHFHLGPLKVMRKKGLIFLCINFWKISPWPVGFKANLPIISFCGGLIKPQVKWFLSKERERHIIWVKGKEVCLPLSPP